MKQIKEEGCICEDDNKLTQAYCPIHGAPAYRVPANKVSKVMKTRHDPIKPSV